MRSPDSKKDALLSVLGTRMSAQLLINIIMCALSENILIRLRYEDGLLLQGMHCLILLLWCHIVTLHSHSIKPRGSTPGSYFTTSAIKRKVLLAQEILFPEYYHILVIITLAA